MYSITKTISSALLLLAASAMPAFAGTITVSHAEAEMEDDGTTADVFMTITNTGSTTDRLYAVKTSAARKVILTSLSEEEEMKLEAHGEKAPRALGYDVTPGKPLVFNEDGAHIEILGLKKAYEPGDRFEVTLFFENAGRVRVMVTVEEEHEKDQ